MATNNATNTSKPLSVPQGGTGLTSTTSYAVLCGGTSSTGALQSIAGVGTSAQILTSNGAGALPTFQAPPVIGYTLSMVNFSSNNVPDGVTYFMNGTGFSSLTGSGFAGSRLYIPKTGTITKAYGTITVTGTLGSNETSTIAIRLNNTTDTNVTTTLQLTAVNNTWNNTGLSISVTAGDFIEFKFIGAATFATNPTLASFSGTIYIS